MAVDGESCLLLFNSAVPNIWPRKSNFESHLQEKLNSASLGGSNPGPSQERPVFKTGRWPAHEKEALRP